ncbi:MAG: hypothetical protein F4X81_01695, partial [Gammaproteobacteria bacterium]|nr:hypothetical protein [Gammaproteobacteria bacterium]
MNAAGLEARCAKGQCQRPLVPLLVVIALLSANPSWGDDTPPAPETASEVQGAAPTRPSPQPIEEALGEAFDDTGSPLDAVAVDIENAEYAKAEAFLAPYLRAVEAARHRYHPDLVRPLLLLG